MKKSIYTKPKVCRSDKGWYVWFRYSKKLCRYKLGINHEKDLIEREKLANALAYALEKKLKKDWNPLVPELPQLGEELTLMDAIDFCLEQKKQTLSAKSISGYKGTVKFINASIDRLDLNLLKIHDVKRAHIRTVIDEARQHYKWSNKNRNKHLNHLKALMSELLEHDILENNPAHKIKNLRVAESRSNIPPTPEEHNKIRTCLLNEHPNFYVFITTLFHTGIRPNEILQIKLGMVDLKNREIIMPPEITKTNKERIVPINNQLADYFEAMDLQFFPNYFYLFGSYREAGKGNIGKHIDFIPGPTKIKRDTATKKWHKIIKTGLEIPVNMYAYKHFGADQKILAGIDLDSLRELYGHTSKLMTMRYAKVVKEVYRNEIIDKSPEF